MGFLQGNGQLSALNTKRGRQAGFEVGRLWLERAEVFKHQDDMQVDTVYSSLEL